MQALNTVNPIQRTRIWHPLAFALQPILALYAANNTLISPHALIRPTLVLVLGTLLLWIVLRLILRSNEKSALLTSLLVFGFFFWGHFVDRIIPTAQASHTTLYFIGYCIVLLGLVAAICLLKSTRASTKFFHVAGGMLLLFALVSLAIGSAQSTKEIGIRHSTKRARAWDAVNIAQTNKRDVVVILLDAYPRSDVLRDDYHVDNAPFLDALSARGFNVSSNSLSNYDKTLWSVGSMLNGAYLDKFLPMGKTKSASLSALVDRFQHSRVFRLFSRHRYTLYAFETGFDNADMRDSVNYFIRPHTWGTEFESLLIQMTPIPQIYTKLSGNNFLYEKHRNRIHFVHDQVIDLAKRNSKSPRFIWTHMNLPHDPIIFDADGGPRQIRKLFMWGGLPPANLTWDEYAALYGEQLTYLHKLVLEMLDAFLSQPPEKRPIIVLFSDHGAGNLPNGAGCADHFKNLCAVYVPPSMEWTPPEPMILVDLFPSIINMMAEPGAPISLSSETRLYSVNWDHPYIADECE